MNTWKMQIPGALAVKELRGLKQAIYRRVTRIYLKTADDRLRTDYEHCVAPGNERPEARYATIAWACSNPQKPLVKQLDPKFSSYEHFGKSYGLLFPCNLISLLNGNLEGVGLCEVRSTVSSLAA